MLKRIAIIGSGISGLVSAYLLSERYDVTLFEANDYLGGHTHTVDVEIDQYNYLIDTGFIVFNQKTYPQFSKLLNKHNIPIQKTEMSFSYRSDTKNLEYNSHNLNTLFADRRNLIKPQFYQFLSEILRFNKDAKKILANTIQKDIYLYEFFQQHRYSKYFIECYFLPMVAAIWSKNQKDVLNCSVNFILQFFANHGLLDSFKRPEWYILTNGSHSYIPSLTRGLNQIHMNTKIECIEREASQVTLKSATDHYIFDAVVIATHSDQALNMLAHPTNEEQHILSAIPYTNNDVILHTDISVLPKRQLAWASWNFFDNQSDLSTLTYYMNRLQSINGPHHFCVSVNLNDVTAEDKIIKRFKYSHPCFNLYSSQIQSQHHLINGKNNTYYAGAYWGYGFHEDGVKSAIKACKPLGVTF